MGRRTKLDAAVLETVVEEIREGTFDWLAAETAGISDRTFRAWMQRGRRGEGQYVIFEAEVRKARAQARAGAEKWVRKHNPLAWLRLGPGRDRRGKPGWTEPAKAGDEPEEDEVDPADPAEMEEFARMVQDAGWDLNGAEPAPEGACRCGHRCAAEGA